ncbi:hypothetical protein CEXT_283381 [Caerostris extrusa]|uniref:Uncharacterized protein n=1 Tax=Caerostris extrusa TaxID=172846 RepID=A0AAV4XL76_CAEEX|nr:hypothetical protein CEXT_283381 [Caerostris extrusa]
MVAQSTLNFIGPSRTLASGCREVHAQLRVQRDDTGSDIELKFQFELLEEDETVLISSPKADTCIFKKGNLCGFSQDVDEIKAVY